MSITYIMEEASHASLMPQVSDWGRHCDDVISTAILFPILVCDIKIAIPRSQVLLLDCFQQDVFCR